MTTRPVLPTRDAAPLFDVAQSREIEHRAQSAVAPHTLMARAGLATAWLAMALAPHAQRVWIACGPGNNGGDGLEAAMHLAAWGKDVSVTLAGNPASLPADARTAHARAIAAGVHVDAAAPTAAMPAELAIDALLGIGASRAPDGEIAALIRQFNALPCPRLAIDLPSGLDADTGTRLGDACIDADHTLALLTLKPGLFTAQGREQAGRVWFDPIGVDLAGEAPRAWLTGVGSSAMPVRRHGQHKGSFGDVAVVGGASGMVGAAVLAARAAHAAGAGRVVLSLLDGRAPTHDPLRPELMFRPGWPAVGPLALAQVTVVCGCGGGTAVRTVLPRLLGGAARLVLDADALNAIAEDPMLQAQLQARAARGQTSILTPHPLEAARLLGSQTSAVQADRLAAARSLADRYACTVVLKGSGTVVASAGAVPSINPDRQCLAGQRRHRRRPGGLDRRPVGPGFGHRCHFGAACPRRRPGRRLPAWRRSRRSGAARAAGRRPDRTAAASTQRPGAPVRLAGARPVLLSGAATCPRRARHCPCGPRS